MNREHLNSSLKKIDALYPAFMHLLDKWNKQLWSY